MPILYSLAISLNLAFASEPCKDFVAYGRIVNDKQKFSLITHENSQEEKKWPIRDVGFKKNLEMQAAVNLLVRVEGIVQGREINFTKIEKSAEAFTLSRGPQAIRVGSPRSCSQ